MNCPKGAPDAAAHRHDAVLAEAAAAGARIAVFPEMSLTGSTDPEHWPGRAVTLAHPAVTAVAGATARRGVAALFGIAEATGDGVSIAQVLADRGAITGSYRKRTLGVDEEMYRAGQAAATFRIDEQPVGICICAESATDAPFDDAAAAGAHVVFFCAAPGLYGRRVDDAGWRAGYDWWTSAGLADARRNARRLHLWVAIATQAGVTDDEDFPGLAALVDPNGDVVASLPDWHAGTLLVDIPD